MPKSLTKSCLSDNSLNEQGVLKLVGHLLGSIFEAGGVAQKAAAQKVASKIGLTLSPIQANEHATNQRITSPRARGVPTRRTKHRQG